MRNHNSDNQRIKYDYLEYLRDAAGNSTQTIDAVAAALDRFEASTKQRDFKKFRRQQAQAFTRRLAEQPSQRAKGRLSRATQHHTLFHLKHFFHWLAKQSGYKHILATDADYFRLSLKDERVATASHEKHAPSVEQVRHVIGLMPTGTEVQKRDRALIAFALITGARDNAIASMTLRDVDVAARRVNQDARHVRTKFSKTFPTFFFPVGKDIVEILGEWVRFLREEKHWGPDDPLFPATRVARGPTSRFGANGLERRQWRSAAPIREIFRKAFTTADLPYFNPHSIRKTLVRLLMDIHPFIELLKAWSQNLGHEDVLTTLRNYGEVSVTRQDEIMRSLAELTPGASDTTARIADLVWKKLRGERS